MAYIYKIINDINNKVYIGKTEFSIEKRFKEHCQDAFRDRNEKRPLYSAMRKYGIEHFHIELIEETDNPEEREIYWIEALKTFKLGYNATLGGDGKAYIDRKLVIRIYNEIQNQKKVAELLNISVDSVHDILVQNNISIKSSKEFLKEVNRKSVAMIDKNTLEILKIFSSIKEAEDYLGISYRSHISEVCNGKRKSCQGYVWKYI